MRQWVIQFTSYLYEAGILLFIWNCHLLLAFDVFSKGGKRPAWFNKMFLTKNQVWKGSNQDRAGTQRSVQTLTVHAETGLEQPKYIRIESDEGSKEKKKIAFYKHIRCKGRLVKMWPTAQWGREPGGKGLRNSWNTQHFPHIYLYW